MTRFGYVRLYRESGGGHRPAQGGLKVGWGPDAGRARKTLRLHRAGFDEVYIGQVGGEHEGFFDFYSSAVLPRLREG